MKRKIRRILLILLFFILGVEVVAGGYFIKKDREEKVKTTKKEKAETQEQETVTEDEIKDLKGQTEDVEKEPDNIEPDTEGIEKSDDYRESNGDIIIALDPGHQSEKVDMSAKEQNAPNSDIMKAKATGGTAGSFTKLKEYQLNLDVAFLVRDALEAKGYQVVMTREDNETAISNRERAEMANDIGANISVRIHANGSENSSAQGALCLVMSEKNPNVKELYNDSYRLAETVLNSYCMATGFKNQGIQKNDTMTGINWSCVPVMILEMGFMTNKHDDVAMADKEFQKTMAAGIAEGIDQYFREYQ